MEIVDAVHMAAWRYEADLRSVSISVRLFRVCNRSILPYDRPLLPLTHTWTSGTPAAWLFEIWLSFAWLRWSLLTFDWSQFWATWHACDIRPAGSRFCVYVYMSIVLACMYTCRYIHSRGHTCLHAVYMCVHTLTWIYMSLDCLHAVYMCIHTLAWIYMSLDIYANNPLHDLRVHGHAWGDTRVNIHVHINACTSSRCR